MASDKVDIARLAEAVSFSEYGMDTFRKERVRVVRRLAGSRYADALKKTVYVNLTQLCTTIISRSLIPSTPRINLSTFNSRAQPMIDQLETWGNQEIDAIDLAETERRAVIDAMCAIAIVKVGLASPDEAAVYNRGLEVGTPFAKNVDLDDWGFDLNVKDFRESSFMYNVFEAPLDVVRESKRYSKERKDLQPSEPPLYTPAGSERASAITGNGTQMQGQFQDMVRLCEVWVPRYRCIYTYTWDDVMGASSSNKAKPLGEQDWKGPDRGPFHILSFNQVPGNPFPKGFLLDLIDLDELYNSIFRKLAQSARDLKEILLVSGMDKTEMIDKIQKSNHGDCLGVDRPEQAKPVTFGSINAGLLQLLRDVYKLYSILAGNLETLGGLSPQAGTLGQEELLAKQASGQVAAMQSQTVKHLTGVVQDLLWWYYHHPKLVMKTRYDLAGFEGISTARELHPYDAPDVYDSVAGRVKQRTRRDVPWEDLQLKIDPYSMQHQTPQQKAMALKGFVTQVFAPFAQLFAQNGHMLNVEELTRLLGKYEDQPDYTRLVQIQDPPAPTDGGEGGVAEVGQDPGQTNRVQTSTRRSLGPDSPAAQEMMANNAMLESMGSMNGSMNGTPQY